ncbi:MAG: hypothetical protein ACK56I_01615, partial [bacterium]
RCEGEQRGEPEPGERPGLGSQERGSDRPAACREQEKPQGRRGPLLPGRGGSAPRGDSGGRLARRSHRLRT